MTIFRAAKHIGRVLLIDLYTAVVLHASVADLKRFTASLALHELVPIHSFETARFGEFFENIVQREDGKRWDV